MILESSPFCLKSFHCCIFSLALSVFWIPTDKDDGHISHCLIQFEHVFVINNTELIDKHCYNTIQKAEISRVGLDCSSSNNFRSLYVIKAERRFWSLCQGNEMVCTDAVSSSVTLINGSLILDIHVYCFLSLFSDLIMRFLLYKREQYLWRHSLQRRGKGHTVFPGVNILFTIWKTAKILCACLFAKYLSIESSEPTMLSFYWYSNSDIFKSRWSLTWWRIIAPSGALAQQGSVR